MSRKYLKNLSYIPVEEELGKDGPHWKKWKKQIKKNGFADYEVWNLDIKMVELLYERLQRFMEISLADAEATEVEWRGRRYSGADYYNKILRKAKYVLENAYDPDKAKKVDKKYRQIWQMFALVRPWW